MQLNQIEALLGQFMVGPNAMLSPLGFYREGAYVLAVDNSYRSCSILAVTLPPWPTSDVTMPFCLTSDVVCLIAPMRMLLCFCAPITVLPACFAGVVSPALLLLKHYQLRTSICFLTLLKCQSSPLLHKGCLSSFLLS